MSAIYIHVPFCKSKCSYCSFYSVDKSENIEPWAKAVISEADIRKTYLTDKNVHSVYFGGGTPSYIPVVLIEEIMSFLGKKYSFNPGIECTIEANPDDISIEWLKKVKQAGFNRLSVGIQSFIDNELLLMNRRHNANQAIDSVKKARSVGFENVSIDLIYGIPGSSIKSWNENLNKVLSLQVDHISAYCLSVDEGTSFYTKLKDGSMELVDDELQIEQYRLLNQVLTDNGFCHYEISNFAKPGHKSLHNSSYWNQTQYLGLGPSAHSFNGFTRDWNCSNISKYIEGIQNNSNFSQREELSISDKLNDYILTSLRTKNGFDLQYSETNFGSQYTKRLISKFDACIQKGWMKDCYGFYVMTLDGWLLSDAILQDLIFID
ncbi:MAG: coproporphyrinogen III oxidase [Marinilabiliales bacterium]|nr:MAG: coproporphyrinogen III oxidase [Marinilabiliales bacterium]